jgi:phosphoketolase
MKSFTEYLIESKKTYAFKVKVAGELPEGFAENLKTAMTKFSIANLSKGKRSPIQEVQLDFPELKNESVTVFELEVHYPTTPQVLQAYIGEVCKCSEQRLRVRSANEPSEHYEEVMKEKDTEYKSLLQTEEIESESAQDKVGDKYISTFLKDLQAASKERAQKDQPKAPASEAMPEGTSISPIGSKATKGK